MEASTIFPLTSTGTESAFKRSRSVGRSLWLVLTQGAIVAIGLHALFVLLFWRLGAPWLTAVHAATAAAFALVWALLRTRRNQVAIVLTWGCVMAQTALSVQALGWDSGFHYYLLTFIPVIFVSKTQRVVSKVALLVGLCGFYLVLDAATRGHVPTLPMSAPALSAMRYLNIVLTFGVLGLLAFYYFRQVGESEARLRRMASTDPLTGLYNRRRLMEFAEYEAVRRKRSAAPMCVLLADIDHFKGFNDRYGHETGDRVLQTVAEVWRQTLREQDTIARWGGEEFIAVMPGADLAAAEAVANRLREAVAVSPIEANGQLLTVCMTFGVSQYRPIEPIEACIARADEALYAGKAGGRNCVVCERPPEPEPEPSGLPPSAHTGTSARSIVTGR